MTAPVLEGQALAAVKHRGSPMQIIASAGSGKTEVISLSGWSSDMPVATLTHLPMQSTAPSFRISGSSTDAPGTTAPPSVAPA